MAVVPDRGEPSTKIGVTASLPVPRTSGSTELRLAMACDVEEHVDRPVEGREFLDGRPEPGHGRRLDLVGQCGADGGPDGSNRERGRVERPSHPEFLAAGGVPELVRTEGDDYQGDPPGQGAEDGVDAAVADDQRRSLEQALLGNVTGG